MTRNKNNGLPILLIMAVIGFTAVLFTSSCGKGSKNTTSQNTLYQVVNLSPTLGPVSLYINYSIYNNYSFYYPNPSGYFNLSSTQIPFQIRASPNQLSGSVIIAGNIIVRNDVLAPNTRYTLFVTGLAADSNIHDPVFLVDTAPAPAKGRGKVRFLNASPQAPNFDIAANGYLDTGFTNIAYHHASSYVEMPAGNYNFQVYQHGDKTNVLGTLQNMTIQDGRLYTLYSRGVVGHTIDTLAFGLGAIVNK